MNIKQTLAYSLHEVARILGEGKLVEEELVPVFEEMIQVRRRCVATAHVIFALRRTKKQCRWG